MKSLSFLNSTDGSTAPSAIDPTRLESPKSTGVDFLESTPRSNSLTMLSTNYVVFWAGLVDVVQLKYSGD